MDTVSKAKRSEIMSRIRSRDTKPELALAEELRRAADPGLPFERDAGDVDGRPDFAFRQVRLAVFVDGCFFHGCPRHYKEPKSNVAFWRGKIARNRERDRQVRRRLNYLGWSVMRVWEHEVRRDPAAVAGRVLARARRAPGARAWFRTGSYAAMRRKARHGASAGLCGRAASRARMARAASAPPGVQTHCRAQNAAMAAVLARTGAIR